MQRDKSGDLDKLRDLLGEAGMDRRRFLRRAVELGLSVALAYELIGTESAQASVNAQQNLDGLDRRLAERPTGKVIAPQSQQSGEMVDERIRKLRQRYAGEQAAASKPGGASKPRQMAQDDWSNWNDWNNWDNWDNWNNWDNWQDWANWGNGD